MTTPDAAISHVAAPQKGEVLKVALNDWKRIEIYNEEIISHWMLASEVCDLCYHVSQVIADQANPYKNYGHSEYSDDVIKIVYDHYVSQYSSTNNHTIEVIYKPKDVAVLNARFELPERLSGSVVSPSDRRINLFRVGSWIDHLATLQPKVKFIHDNFEAWRQSHEQQQAEANKKRIFGRID